MTTSEIAPKSWEQFCQRIHELHHGTMISIQHVHPDGSTRALAKDMPLQAFAFDSKSDACNDAVVIEAGLPNERPLQHRVIEPIRIMLKNGAHNDRYNQLQILAENGTTVLMFHPGINPALLKRLDAH